MLEQYPHAAEELTWRFLRADAVLGMRGQAIEGGGGGGAFDAASCERMHLARNAPEHRNALRKREAIDATLRQVTRESRTIIEQAFEPFGRASAMLAACFTVGRVALVQVAVHTKAAHEAFTRKKGNEPPSGWAMLQWLEDEARTQGRTDADAARLRGHKFTGHVFERILNECQKSAEAAIADYEGWRVRRRREATQLLASRNAELLDAECAALHLKLWGSPAAGT